MTVNPDRIAQAANVLAEFCGTRDLPVPTREALERECGMKQVDVMVLFGGSILEGGEVLAQAMKNGVAKKYIIVGGAGHTTETLRDKARALLPSFDPTGLPEARVFAGWLKARHDLEADYLEEKSTNCGNNITFLLELLRREKVECRSILLCQDATMQRRMDAGLRKYASEMNIVNYAAYNARFTVKDGRLTVAEPPLGMWDAERYLMLLMGEIPRLTDDENGYGPRGKNFIAHVEIPGTVREAFAELKAAFPDGVRPADSRYSG